MHQWDDGTMAYFSLHVVSRYHPSCGQLSRVDRMEAVSCFDMKQYFCEKEEISQQKQTSDRDTSGNRADQIVTVTNSSVTFKPVTCPTGHLTHEFLACDSLSYCWQQDQPGQRSASGARSSESHCQSHFSALFTCRTEVGNVPYSLVCDHVQDCQDFSDEDFCVHPSCSGSWQFECSNKQVKLFKH